MSPEALDADEQAWLDDRLSPPAFQFAFFFLLFVPIFGAAVTSMVWHLAASGPMAIAVGSVFGGVALLYFPFVGTLRRLGREEVRPDEPLTWTGEPRRAPAPDGAIDVWIGEHRVVLPLGWEARVFAVAGPVMVRGVRARVPNAPVYLLDVEGRGSVRGEVPMGLLRYDAPAYYFVLAFLALVANFAVSPACSFSYVGADGHLFTLLTAVCLAYGARVMRQNAAIAARIEAAYG